MTTRATAFETTGTQAWVRAKFRVFILLLNYYARRMQGCDNVTTFIILCHYGIMDIISSISVV